MLILFYYALQTRKESSLVLEVRISWLFTFQTSWLCYHRYTRRTRPRTHSRKRQLPYSFDFNIRTKRYCSALREIRLLKRWKSDQIGLRNLLSRRLVRNTRDNLCERMWSNSNSSPYSQTGRPRDLLWRCLRRNFPLHEEIRIRKARFEDRLCWYDLSGERAEPHQIGNKVGVDIDSYKSYPQADRHPRCLNRCKES